MSLARHGQALEPATKGHGESSGKSVGSQSEEAVVMYWPPHKEVDR